LIVWGPWRGCEELAERRSKEETMMKPNKRHKWMGCMADGSILVEPQSPGRTGDAERWRRREAGPRFSVKNSRRTERARCHFDTGNRRRVPARPVSLVLVHFQCSAGSLSPGSADFVGGRLFCSRPTGQNPTNCLLCLLGRESSTCSTPVSLAYNFSLLWCGFNHLLPGL
jgi:hypothetical protein